MTKIFIGLIIFDFGSGQMTLLARIKETRRYFKAMGGQVDP